MKPRRPPGTQLLQCYLPTALVDNVDLLLVALRRVHRKRITRTQYLTQLLTDDLAKQFAPGSEVREALTLSEDSERHISELAQENPNM